MGPWPKQDDHVPFLYPARTARPLNQRVGGPEAVGGPRSMMPPIEGPRVAEREAVQLTASPYLQAAVAAVVTAHSLKQY